jgi:hypothetical protein
LLRPPERRQRGKPYPFPYINVSESKNPQLFPNVYKKFTKLLALALDECQYKCYITPRTKEEANAKPKESVPEFSKK